MGFELFFGLHQEMQPLATTTGQDLMALHRIGQREEITQQRGTDSREEQGREEYRIREEREEQRGVERTREDQRGTERNREEQGVERSRGAERQRGAERSREEQRGAETSREE
jgi:hypothetical protein